MTDKSSTAGNSPFSVVDEPFPDLFAGLTDRVGPIRFATVTDSGLLVTVEIPVEVDGSSITSTLGPEAAFDINTVVLKTTFEPSVDRHPDYVLDLVVPLFGPGFLELRSSVAGLLQANFNPNPGRWGEQLSPTATTALETDLVPGVTILTSDPDLVIELFMEPPPGLLPLADLGPDVPFAGMRMIVEEFASLLPAGPAEPSTATSTMGFVPGPEPHDTDLPTSSPTSTPGSLPGPEPDDTDLPTSTATSTMGSLPGPEPDTTDLPTSSPTSTHGMDLGPDATYLVATNTDPTGAPTDDFTLDITPEPDDTDLPTSTATSTMGGAVGDDGYPPPRRPGIKLVLIGGIILATLSGATVWAVSQSGGGEVAVDGGAGQILVDPDSAPLDPPPSSLIPASSTSSTSSTTSAPSSSSTSSTSTSSTSTSSTSTSSTTSSIVPPPVSSDAPPSTSTSSTTSSTVPPPSSTSTTSTTTTTTTPPAPESKTGTDVLPCPASQGFISTWVDFFITNGALRPTHTINEPLVCPGSTLKVTGALLSTPQTGKWTYRVNFGMVGGPQSVAGSDSVTITISWINP